MAIIVDITRQASLEQLTQLFICPPMKVAFLNAYSSEWSETHKSLTVRKKKSTTDKMKHEKNRKEKKDIFLEAETLRTKKKLGM